MRKCSLTNLDALLRTMADTATVYLPVDGTDGRAHFTKWEDGVKMSEALNTVRSAKDFFFPQTENLVDFKMEGKTIEVIDIREECEDFVIFGVRGCGYAWLSDRAAKLSHHKLLGKEETLHRNSTHAK